MKIKTKILGTLLSMSLLVALVGGLAVERQFAAAMLAVTKEASDVARIVSFLFVKDSGKPSASLQDIVSRLHQSQGRDVVVTDVNQMILADAVAGNLGKAYTDDPSDDVGKTLRDHQVRTFVETSLDYPQGIKQIVVPIEGEKGHVMGTVILEYTPLYNEMMQLTRATTRQVVWAALASAAIAIMIAIGMGGSIALPLQQLTNEVARFGAGRMDLATATSRKDEIGDLAAAFQCMAQKRQGAEDELRRMRDDLEVRVAERTAELEKANAALQLEIADRRQIGEALEVQQSELRVLFDLMPAMILFKDTENNILRVNKRVAETAGMAVEDIEGKASPDVLPHDAAKFYADDLEVIRSGLPKLGILETVRDNQGKTHWLQTDKVPVLNKDGKVVAIVVMVQDITERRRVEDELKESKIAAIVRAGAQRYSFLADTVPLIIWTARPDGCADYFNRVWYDYTRLPLNQAEDWGWSAVVHPEDLERSIARWTHSVDTGENYEIEYRFKRAEDAAYRWFLGRATARRNDEGEIVQWVGTCTDIDDQKRARSKLEELIAGRTAELAQTNEALQRQQNELRVLFDLMPAMILFKDTKNNILRVNQRVAENAGMSIEQIEGKAAPDVFPHDSKRFYAEDLEVIRSGKPRLGIVETMHDMEGREIWIETDKVPVCDDAGGVIGIVVMAQDITERKRAEVELESIHKRLVDASRRAGMAEIATNVLHNVGNVLNSVNVSASLVAESVRRSRVSGLSKVVALLQEHAHDLGEFITTDPRGRHVPAHLALLSDHLLADKEAILGELSGLRGNIEHIKEIVAMQQSYASFGGLKELINVVSLVEDSMRMNQEGLGQERIQVIRDFEEVPPMNVEKHKILQILVNLLRNARHACQDSGRPDMCMTVRVARHNGSVQISVADNGIGIAGENLARVFNHGFTTRPQGHGFGLHSGALAAQEMGGSLTVRSEGPGTGAVFTLELPASTMEAPA